MREMSGAGSAQARAEVGEARAGAAAAGEAPAGGPSPLPRELRWARGEREPGAKGRRGARCDGAREAEALSGLRVGGTASAQVQGTGRDGTGGASAAPGGCGSDPREAPCSSALLPAVPAVSALPPNFLETCVLFRPWQISFNIPLQQSLAS